MNSDPVFTDKVKQVIDSRLSRIDQRIHHLEAISKELSKLSVILNELNNKVNAELSTTQKIIDRCRDLKGL